MAKEKSPSFSIDKKGLIKVGKGALIAGAAAVLTYLEGTIPSVDFGEFTSVVVAFNAVLVNFARNNEYLLWK